MRRVPNIIPADCTESKYFYDEHYPHLFPTTIGQSAMLEVMEYFGGKVKSIAFQTATLPATVGVMEAGNYEFNTAKRETVTVVSGSLAVKLPGSDEWHSFPAGTTFVVAANRVFHLQVAEETAYMCTYE
jgi:uncharacterized protein YaiE (UPF0345 family)